MPEDPVEDQRKPARSLETSVAVVETKVDGMMERLGALTNSLNAIALDIRQTYATKEEVRVIDQKVNKISESLGWVVKLIIGAVLASVLGLVLYKSGHVQV